VIDLYSWALVNNYKIAWGNIKCLSDSLDEFQTLSRTGQLNDLQNKKFSEWMSNNHIRNDKMNTVILVAYSVSGKSRQILFDFNGLEVTALLPPCYGDDGHSWRYEMLLEKSLSDYLLKYGYRIERLSGPYKNLAARLGLGKYGRNNLIYVEGFGSYIRIVGFVTDAEFTREFSPGLHTEKTNLENCEKCNLCKQNCPTHAIGDDRFQLHVDRCLAYQNERPEEWTPSIKYAKNNCLVGCLLCQAVCPHNTDFISVGTILSERFGQEETDYILGVGGIHKPEIIESVYEKTDRLGLSRHKEYIVRNMQACIHLMKGDEASKDEEK
jgi:epoxyqueuosine reductase